MKVNITKEDIFHYVVGISCYDALERIIDPTRYSLHADSIWDSVDGRFIKQDEAYAYYYSQVNNLKEFAPQIEVSEIRRLCEEIEQRSPKEIFLTAYPWGCSQTTAASQNIPSSARHS